MKKRLLIITEDVVHIQTFSGWLGNIYSFLYQLLLKLKLRLTIFILHYKYDITVLSTDKHKHKFATFLSYSEQLDPSKIAKYKPLAWKLTSKISKTINQADQRFAETDSIFLISLWENKIASKLMYYYLSYLELLTRMITSNEYSCVLILDNSIQGQIAKSITQEHKIKLRNYSYINLNSLNNILFRFFRQRELKRKINIFKIQSNKPKPPVESFSNSILFSVDFFRHLKTLIPVYKQLQELRPSPLLITDELSIESYLKNFKLENFNYTFLASFLSASFIKNSLDQWQQITKIIHQKVSKKISIKPTNIEQLILSLIFPEISPIIKQGLILSKLYLSAGEKLFETLKPRCLVVAADVRITELALSYLAKKHKMPSITVSPRTIMFEEEVYKYNLTDFISVTGQHAKDKLIKLTVSPKKIIINGDPRYDYFSNLEKNFSAKSAFQKLGIKPTKKKIILLISERPNSYLPKEEKKDIFLQVSQAKRNHKNSILVIKPHPTERKFRLVEELKQWGITNAIISDNKKIELFDLLKLSSTIIMVWSMTGLEAMMLKRPVIIVNPHKKDFDKYIPYLKNKAAVQSCTSLSLTKYLNIYTNHQHPKTKKLIALGLKFSENYIQKPDGKVAQRISKHILKAS